MYSIWRYGEFLGLDIKTPLKDMGVGWTPLVPIHVFGSSIYLKLEFLAPSGSFKDRGVNAMVNQLVQMGVKSMVEDSSGNAGASLAAHAARFGIPAEIYVPAYASPAKIQQIEVYGVEVIPVPGPRKAAEEAAQASVTNTKAYASHAYNPAYLAGQVTAAWELWEQLGRKAPDWIICPVAQGGQFLGYWMGFSNLLKAGLIDRLPRLVAVQAARIAPIYKAWSQGLDHIPSAEQTGVTIAEGVSISKPARGKRLIQALTETKGRVLVIEEEEILKSQQILSHMGFFIEPTSALALAGFLQMKTEIGEKEIVVLPLTGSGLKGHPSNH
jgi:threonine synthase